MDWNKNNWWKLLISVLAIVGIVLFFRWQQHQQEVLRQAQQATEQQEQSITQLKDMLSISQDNATKLAEKISSVQSGTKQPNVSFAVQAPTVYKAADVVQERINDGDTTLPMQAIENTDRTVVTPREQEQKVDVYKINLRKDHRIKAGVSVVDGKGYVTVGYEQGRVEGLVHSNGKEYGASIMYNVAEW